MNSRRDFLQIYARCAGVPGGGNAVPIDLDRRDGFPDVGAFVHTGEAVRFYEDCVQGKASGTDNAATPTQDVRGELHVARQPAAPGVHREPREDGAAARRQGRARDLRDLHHRGSARGHRRAARAVRERAGRAAGMALHAHAAGAVGIHHPAHVPPQPRRSGVAAGVLRQRQHAAVGLRPEDAADRISWVLPRPRPEGLRRGGPSRPGQSRQPWNNRAV